MGRGSKGLREFMEKGYKEDMSERDSIKLAVETLMEVVESSKNIEISVMRSNNKNEMLEDDAIDKYVKEIEKEREESEQVK